MKFVLEWVDMYNSTNIWTNIRLRTLTLASTKSTSPPNDKYKYVYPGIFTCIRDVETAKRERRDKIGFIPAFDADMLALAEGYGRMTKEEKDFLATLIHLIMKIHDCYITCYMYYIILHNITRILI